MSVKKIFVEKGKTRMFIERYIIGALGKVGYSRMEIHKGPLSTRIILNVEKPPLVIGHAGSKINQLTEDLKEKFKMDDPRIDVQGIKEPYLDARIMAEEITDCIERGDKYRMIAHRAVDAVMAHGALGVEINLSGKIKGKGERGSTEKFRKGYMKKTGFPLTMVRHANVQARLKQGVIGISVDILPPDLKFPDKITLKTPPKKNTSVPTVPVQPTKETVVREVVKEDVKKEVMTDNKK
ncbi:MAG: 30S ribosomal protein S3 [Candidatus Altiarchaeales archaeon A3]|nr:MAG: 30S ribosomal protein S3 [Candidatus Altiarchaeales archaeon A3]